MPPSSTSSSRLLARWEYCTLNERVDMFHIPFLSRLRSLKAVWASRQLEIPDDWVSESPVSGEFTYAFEAKTSKPIVNALRRIRHMISPLPLHAQNLRTMDYAGPEPDFIGAVSIDEDYALQDIKLLKEVVLMDNFVNFRRLQSLLNFPYVLQSDGSSEAPELISKQLSDCLEEFPGFFLRQYVLLSIPFKVGVVPCLLELNNENITRQVSNTLDEPSDRTGNQNPVDFALLIRQHGSKPESKWTLTDRGFYDTLLWSQNRAIACSMQVSPTHPAVIIGIIDRDADSCQKSLPPSASSRNGSDPSVRRLALQVEPSLDSILETWNLRQQQRGGSSEPPPWLIVFGFIITNDDVTIVAHFPIADGVLENPGPLKNYCSCIMDKVSFHPEVQWIREAGGTKRWTGPTTTDTWISDRLRLFLALLAIVKNSRLISAIWDDIDWPRELLDTEDALEKQHAQWDSATPNPSDTSGDENPLGLSVAQRIVWETELDTMEESDDEGLSETKLEDARLRILDWRNEVYLCYK